MRAYLENTISALVHELCAVYSVPSCETRPPYNDVVRFVEGEMDRMPSFLAWAIRAATILFGASRLIPEGTLFHRRDTETRRIQVEAWMRSGLGPCRDLMKFYSSLAVLALYSRPLAAGDRSDLND